MVAKKTPELMTGMAETIKKSNELMMPLLGTNLYLKLYINKNDMYLFLLKLKKIINLHECVCVFLLLFLTQQHIGLVVAAP